MKLSLSLCLLVAFSEGALAEDLPKGTARVDFFGYKDCVKLENETTRVVLCHQAGGRVLDYSLNGTNVIYLDPEAAGASGKSGRGMTGGRFDIGPEQIVPRRNLLWSGKWTAEITGPYSARMTSQYDIATGVRLIRDFKLSPDSSALEVTQTIHNQSNEEKQWCHWSRTFAVGKGIVLIPLTGQSKYPNSYVMYEGSNLIQMRPVDEQIKIRDGYLEIKGAPKFPKLGMDTTAGWFTYLAPNDLLFTKQFEADPNRVYNEVAGLTMSIWYPDRPMVELEPIGPRETLAPGKKASFTEHWTLQKYPFPATGTPVDLKSIEKLVTPIFNNTGQ